MNFYFGACAGNSLGECGSSASTERPGACLLTRCLTTAPIQQGALT